MYFLFFFVEGNTLTPYRFAFRSTSLGFEYFSNSIFNTYISIPLSSQERESKAQMLVNPPDPSDPYVLPPDCW
jgi:hypothetical protein